MTTIARRIRKGTAAGLLAFSGIGLATSAALAGAKSPPPSYDATFENVSAELFSIKFRIPKIEVKGANIAKADIEKLFAADNTAPLAERLKGFTAESVTAPAVEYNLELGPLKASGTQDGVKFEKVNAGKIGKASYSGGALQLSADDLTAKDVFKGAVVNDLDLAHALRVWNEKAGPDDKQAKQLYSSATMDGFTMDTADKLSTSKIEYGKLTILTGSKVPVLSRPLKESVTEVMTALFPLLGKDFGPDNGNIKLLKSGLRGIIELVEGYQLETYTFDGYNVTQTVKPPGIEPIVVTAQIGPSEMKPGLATVNGIAISVPGKGVAKIASMSLKDPSLAPLLTVAKEMVNRPTDEYSQEDFIRLAFAYYACIGTMNIHDVDADVTVPAPAPAAAPAEDDGDVIDEGDDTATDDAAPKAEQPAAPAPAPVPTPVNIKVKLKDLTLRMAQPVNGVPSNIRFAIDNLQMPVSVFGLDGEASSRLLVQQLTEFGYKDLNLSFALDSAWNKDTNELAINEIRVAEEAAGNALLKGTIGNFTQEMFSLDVNKAQAAAIGLLAKNLSLHIEDKGLTDRALKFTAAQQGLTAEQLKTSVPLMLAMIPEQITNLPSVATIKKAFLDFWNKPGQLDIAIKAKNGGLGLADFLAAAQDPSLIDAKIEVSAEAK